LRYLKAMPQPRIMVACSLIVYAPPVLFSQQLNAVRLRGFHTHTPPPKKKFSFILYVDADIYSLRIFFAFIYSFTLCGTVPFWHGAGFGSFADFFFSFVRFQLRFLT
jgi:hypothetical protein